MRYLPCHRIFCDMANTALNSKNRFYSTKTKRNLKIREYPKCNKIKEHKIIDLRDFYT